MPLHRASLQALGAAAILAVAVACGGKNQEASPETSTTATLSGTITYQRVPLATDAQGVPTGLSDASVATNLKSLPARGTTVRVYQQLEQTQPDGTKILVWVFAGSGFTDSSGKYLLTVAKDRPTMVEILSSFDGGGGEYVHVDAEPGGMQSITPALHRLRYALRKAADGTAPSGVNTPSSTLTANATVDFSVGLNDAWWLVDASLQAVSGTSLVRAPHLTEAVSELSVPGRSAGTGSRILGIGDTIATFVAAYGSATPGSTLDLHYAPGQSELRGSYVEYDASAFPQAYDPASGRFRYFGSLRGGAGNDDAWDEGVLLPLLARNRLYASTAGRTFFVPLNPLLPCAAPLTDLSPDLARVEGFADAMAASLLKSPYLADTAGTSLAAPVTDIRDVSGLAPSQLSPYSARALRALTWDIFLKANSLPNPGTPTDWAKINPLATLRFFIPPVPASSSGVVTPDPEPINLYTQLARFKETKASSEPVDLAAIFTDAVLTPMAAPYGLPWPRPTTGAYATFAADWGTDPNSASAAVPSVTLSMAKAVQVNGLYPNVSQGEVAYAGFKVSADKRYVLSATLSPALGSGAEVDLDLPMINRTFTFTGSGGSAGTVVIPAISTPPYYHPVRLRLKSPAAVQPDVTVSVAFTPAP